MKPKFSKHRTRPSEAKVPKFDAAGYQDGPAAGDGDWPDPKDLRPLAKSGLPKWFPQPKRRSLTAR